MTAAPQHSWASYAPSEGIKFLGLTGNVMCECHPPQDRDFYSWALCVRKNIGMIKSTSLHLQGVLFSAFCPIWLKTQCLQWWMVTPSFLYGSEILPSHPLKYSFPHIQVPKIHQSILPLLQMTDCFVMNHWHFRVSKIPSHIICQGQDQGRAFREQKGDASLPHKMMGTRAQEWLKS